MQCAKLITIKFSLRGRLTLQHSDSIFNFSHSVDGTSVLERLNKRLHAVRTLLQLIRGCHVPIQAKQIHIIKTRVQKQNFQQLCRCSTNFRPAQLILNTIRPLTFFT